MSDSFADLWSASAAIPPKSKPQTLGSASSSSLHNPTTTRGVSSKPDVFSFLAASTQQQSRYGSPNSIAGKRSTTSTPPVPPPSRGPAPTAGLDAFSDLFSSSAASSNGNVRAQSGLTIAERLTLESQAKGSKSVGEELRSTTTTNVGSQDSAWAGLDSLVRSDTGNSLIPPQPSRPSSSYASRTERKGLLDLDDDDAADFDFGVVEQKDSLLDHSPDFNGSGSAADEHDILGLLSQPVEVVKSKTQTQSYSPSPRVSRQASFEAHLPSTGERSRPRSVSPHILGQITEMGFSAEQAKKALANTKNGQDIQAALESLLGGSAGTEVRRDSPSNEHVAEAAQPVRRGPPKGFRERERERLERMRRDDRILSQASEIGLSVLSKASAFWKEGKEHVLKVYEERAAATIAGQREKVDGRPKWMKEGGVSGFMDEDDEDLKPKGRRIAKTDEPEQRIRQQDTFTDPSASSLLEVETGPTPFTLPTRDPRPLPTTSPSSLSTVDKHRTAGSAQFKLGQYASAVESYSTAISILPPRHLLLLPLFNNRALARMRTGEYKAAADDAAQALGIILVNEDSASASDVFDLNAKETSVQVTPSSWHPSMEPSFLLTAAKQKANNSGWAHPQGFGVDLADGYAKALRRRAEAFEGRERWAEALKLWEVLSAGDSAWVKEHLRKEAQRSAARCRKAISDEALASKGGEEAPPPKRPVPKPRPTPVVSTVPSAALRSLQASNAQAEAEDNLKHQLKDSVDSKLAAWRTGKETNIRALLASLDMVLWEELLRGVKVGGLHELVTPAQVKKGYVKAIARVHPDKLNAQNSTVEQRMLANGVFGTLSEAWISFSNGI